MSDTTGRWARALGMKPSEVISVEDSPAGTVITTFDGQALIDVPVDRPDADGKSGLMLLAAPTVGYRGTFPIYAQPGADDAAEPGGLPDGPAAAVLAWVAGDADRAREALDAERAKRKPGKGLVEELEQILDQEDNG